MAGIADRGCLQVILAVGKIWEFRGVMTDIADQVRALDVVGIIFGMGRMAVE